MTIEPLVPDVSPQPASGAPDAGGFLAALDAAGSVFDAADRAEAAFARGTGGLQEMVVARAHADIAVAIATAAASRATQALAQIFSIPV
jgi:flagellar hook-basal body complex protein FliE